MQGKRQCKRVLLVSKKYASHLKEVHGIPAHAITDGWSPLLTQSLDVPSDESEFLDIEQKSKCMIFQFRVKMIYHKV